MTANRLLAARVVAPTVIAALALPAGASAATVTRVEACSHHLSCRDTVVFQAAPGESNRVRVDVSDIGVVVREDGAPLDVGEGCTRRSSTEAACEAGPPPADFGHRVTVDTGDGDDVVRAGGIGDSLVTLGPGNDVFGGQGEAGGGEGEDLLIGAGGDNHLDGGPGRDRLQGGPGDDELRLTDGEPDHADGGPGADLVSYTGTTAPVVVDLADTLTEGGRGERDVVTEVEGAEGGNGRDRLAGDAGDNVLVGRGRDDVLRGRDGDDELYARRPPIEDTIYTEQTRDVLDGGAGDDVVAAAGNGPVQCGAGVDEVLTDRNALPVATACERWGYHATRRTRSRIPLPRAVTGGRIRLRVECPARPRHPGGIHCEIQASAGAGAARIALRNGQSAVLALRVPRVRPVRLVVDVRDGGQYFRAGLRLPLP